MDCPRCGLVNSENAIKCDCGFKLKNSTKMTISNHSADKNDKYICPTCGNTLEQKMPFTKFFALLGGGIDLLFPQFWCHECNKRIPLNQLSPKAKKGVYKMQFIGVSLIVIIGIVGFFFFF